MIPILLIDAVTRTNIQSTFVPALPPIGAIVAIIYPVAEGATEAKTRLFSVMGVVFTIDSESMHNPSIIHVNCQEISQSGLVIPNTGGVH